MTREIIGDRIEQFIRSHFTIASTDRRFSRSVLLFEHGYVDSVGAVELLAFIQEELGVAIPDEDLLSDEFSTIDGIATIVTRLQQATPEASARC